MLGSKASQFRGKCGCAAVVGGGVRARVEQVVCCGMRPRPRIRKTIKWGGAAVTVLMVVVWIVGSAWWSWYQSLPNGKILSLYNGRADVWWPGPCVRPLRDAVMQIDGVVTIVPGPLEFGWWVHLRRDSLGSTLEIPPRIPPVLTLLIVVGSCWLEGRRPSGASLNLVRSAGMTAGLAVGAVCPECGSGGTPA